MNKVWDGTTPYPNKKAATPEELVALLSLRKGYQDAMNSPVVTALYKVLKSLKMAAGKNVADTLPAALAAYEAGLKENT